MNNNILIPMHDSSNVYVLDTDQKAIAMHDALSDYVIAPLGRVNHLQGMMCRIALRANNVDTNEGRLKHDDMDKTQEFLKGMFPECEVILNTTDRGRSITSFYFFVMKGHEFKAFVFASATNNFISYVLPAPSNMMPQFNDHFFQYLPTKKFTVNQWSGGSMSPHTIDEKDTTTHDEFYPFLAGGVKKLYEDFYASRSRLMIFTGIAGTGKSSLMRSALGITDDKFVLLDDPSVYDNPDKFNEFIDAIRKMSVNERVTVFLEEADKILYKKEEGTGALERLLSLASGVIEHNVKIIIASNVEKTTDMYPALLRAGRAFRPIDFRALDIDEANAARKAADMEEVHFTTAVTLAGALNHDNFEDTRVKPAIGFLPAGKK